MPKIKHILTVHAPNQTGNKVAVYSDKELRERMAEAKAAGVRVESRPAR